MSFLLKAIVALLTISLLSRNEIEAYCSRCVKIEEERAKEQAANPQPFRYYDERILLDKEPDSPSSLKKTD